MKKKKMFMSRGSGSGEIDIPNATFVQYSAISVGSGSNRTIYVNPNGTRLFVSSSSTHLVYQYNLSTPYDISTMSFAQSLYLNSANLLGFTFKSDGTKIYGGRYNSGTVYEWNLSTAWELSTATFVQSKAGLNYRMISIDFNNDGTKFYVLDNTDRITSYNLSIAYDISTVVLNTVSDVFTITGAMADNKFLNGGNQLTITDDTNSTAYQISLSTPYDETTIDHLSYKSLYVGGNGCSGCHIIENAKKMYILHNTTDLVSEWNLP